MDNICCLRMPTRQVTHNTSIKNEAERERNRAARQMDTLMKVRLCSPVAY
jgi:hypothetical protein